MHNEHEHVVPEDQLTQIAEAPERAEGELQINTFEIAQRAGFRVTDNLLANLSAMSELERAAWCAAVAGNCVQAAFDSIREQQKRQAPATRTNRRERRAAAAVKRRG